MSKMVREIASWTRSDLTLATSTSTLTRLFLYSEGSPFVCSRGLFSQCDRDGKISKRNSKWSNRYTYINLDEWLDVSAWFIRTMKLRLRPLGLQKRKSNCIIRTISWTILKLDKYDKNNYNYNHDCYHQILDEKYDLWYLRFRLQV